MAAALMSKSFAGVSLRSAVPTKGQVRRPSILPSMCSRPFQDLL